MYSQWFIAAACVGVLREGLPLPSSEGHVMHDEVVVGVR
jgi:hypothetical protein